MNWDRFVSANRGSAERAAQRLQDPFQANLAQATGSLGAAQGAFNRDVASGTYTYDPSNLRRAPNASPYSGPESLEGYGDFQRGQEQADAAATGARRLANVYGRMGALGDTFAAPGYSQGQRLFDSALLGSVAGGQFEGNERAAKALQDSYQSSLTGSREAASGAKKKSEEQAGSFWRDFTAPQGNRYGWGNTAPPPAQPAPRQPAPAPGPPRAPTPRGSKPPRFGSTPTPWH